MSWWKRWLEKLDSKDRRRADRRESPQLAAFFWTGAAPAEHRIRDISSTGLYLVTQERWYPGTLVMMTLQKRNESADSPNRSISVQLKAVRWGEDGVGLQFVLAETRDGKRSPNLPQESVDRKALEHFLDGFQAETGSAIVERVADPLDR